VKHWDDDIDKVVSYYDRRDITRAANRIIVEQHDQEAAARGEAPEPVYDWADDGAFDTPGHLARAIAIGVTLDLVFGGTVYLLGHLAGLW
jgi:hypothetical protein